MSARDPVTTLWIARARTLAALALFFTLPFAPWLGGEIRGRSFAVCWALSSAIVGLSMNVLSGYAGQISLAQAVFWGTGAFSIGQLTTLHGVPWLVALPLAGLITATAAVIIGFPALRIRGLHLAILTIGFQFVMNRVVFRMQWLSRGAAGIEVRRPSFERTTDAKPGFFADDFHFLFVIMAALVVIWFIDRNLTRSRAGRAFFAIRQDERVASSFGIPVARYKLLAFAIAGFYAGISGALFGTLNHEVTNELFDYLVSFEFLVFAVLGGLGSRGGTAFGSAFPVLFRNVFESLRTAGQMLGSVLLVFTLLAYPGGIAQQSREFRHVAHLLRTRGLRWFGAFLGLIAGAFVAGVAAGEIALKVLDPVYRLVAGNRPFEFGRVIAILIGLFGSRIIVEIGSRRLVALSGHDAPTPVVPDEPSGQRAQLMRTAIDVTPVSRRANSRARAAGPLLSMDDVGISFGGVHALDGVTLEVREGELVGLMGPNGAGKTTALNCVSGFLKPSRGEIRFAGRSVLSLPSHGRAALGLGRTFQNIGLVKQESVFDNFVIAQHLECGYGPLEGLLRTGGVLREERRLRERARATIGLLGLEDIVDEKVSALPHGRAKLVELGCALVGAPRLLLLDEPAAGVSPQEAESLGDTLKTIAASFGVTILMIEHHVPLMLSTCDYIYVLNFGRLLTSGAPAEVAAHPEVIAAYLGGAGKEAGLATAGSH